MKTLLQCDVCKSVNAVPFQKFGWYEACWTCGANSSHLRVICQIEDGPDNEGPA